MRAELGATNGPLLVFTICGHLQCDRRCAASPMLKRIGAEVALFDGTRPLHIGMHLLVDGRLQHTLLLKPTTYPRPRSLNQEEQRFMDGDKRQRGEHRPPRITYGPCHRWPYTFYTARVPGDGLPLHGQVCMVLWVQILLKWWPYEPLFHFKYSDPKVHPLTGRTHWVEQKQWSLAESMGWRTAQRDETECGCGVRVQMEWCAGGGG